MKTILALIVAAFCGITHAQIPKSLTVIPFTDFNYPDVEPVYDYELVYPVNADVLSVPPHQYQPSMDQRYFMSVFGPRHKAVSTSNIGFYDYHIGSDMTTDVTFNGVTYDENNPPDIICRCDGVVHEIFDGPEEVLENTGTGRFVTIKCDSSFRANPDWGNMYMAYRHLASVAPGLAEGDTVSMGDLIGVMGASGHTTTVHLHYSLIRRNEGYSRNVHPMRSFDPATIPHLLDHLTTAEITQLNHSASQAMFRIALPYNMANLRAIEVSLPNGAYLRTFDFEEVSDLPEAERDDNDAVDGLELFAYPFNRGQDCHRRVWDAIEDNKFQNAYPGSPGHNGGDFYPFMHEGLFETPAYVLDLLVKDLPPGYDITDLKIRLLDIWGYGVEAYGTGQPSDEHFAWAIIDTEDNDAEEYQDGTMDLNSADLDLVYDGYTHGNQHVGLRFTDVGIPNGATITSAYVQFRADASHSDPVQLSVHAEDSGLSGIFTNDAGNISGRDTTHASLYWTPAAWTEGDMDEAQKMNGLAPLVQEVVMRNDWTPESPLTFLIRGTGRREAEGYSSYYLWRNAYVYVEYTEDPAPQPNEPPVVSLTSPVSGTEYNAPVEITLAADAFDPNNNLATVEFYVNGASVGSVSSAPYQLSWSMPGYGHYTIHAVATDAEGLSNQSQNSAIAVIDQVVEVSITTGSDDVEEIQNGTIWKNNSDLELAYDSFVSGSQGLVGHQYVGLRFRNVAIPQDALITHAYIQFTADETDSDAVTITIRGEYTGDAAPFSYDDHDVSTRAMTADSVTWQPAPWTNTGSAGEAERTPDLKEVVGNITGHPLWSTGNDMVLILYGNETSKRVAESYDGMPAGAASLRIEYTLPVPNYKPLYPVYKTGDRDPVMSVFPNPVSGDELSVTLSAPLEGEAQITLTDLFGRNTGSMMVPEGESGNFIFRVNDLPSGVYFVRLITGKEVLKTEKVLIH